MNLPPMGYTPIVHLRGELAGVRPAQVVHRVPGVADGLEQVAAASSPKPLSCPYTDVDPNCVGFTDDEYSISPPDPVGWPQEVLAVGSHEYA